MRQRKHRVDTSVVRAEGVQPTYSMVPAFRKRLRVLVISVATTSPKKVTLAPSSTMTVKLPYDPRCSP